PRPLRPAQPGGEADGDLPRPGARLAGAGQHLPAALGRAGRHPRHDLRVVAHGTLHDRLRAPRGRRQPARGAHRRNVGGQGHGRHHGHRRRPGRSRRHRPGPRHRALADRRRGRQLRLRRDHRGPARPVPAAGDVPGRAAVRGAQGRWLPDAVAHRHPDRHRPRRPVGHRAAHRRAAPGAHDLPAARSAGRPAGPSPHGPEGGCSMTAPTVPVQAGTPAGDVTTVAKPVSYKPAVMYGLAALVTLLVFARGTEGGTETTFQFASGASWFTIPNWSVPSSPAVWLLAVLLVAATGYAVVRTRQRHDLSAWLHVLVGVAFILAFLVWVGSGRTSVIPVTSLL